MHYNHVKLMTNRVFRTLHWVCSASTHAFHLEILGKSCKHLLTQDEEKYFDNIRSFVNDRNLPSFKEPDGFDK